MRDFRAMARLTKGIVSDGVGVAGALLEADDVVPLERSEGYRTRGGKPITVVTAASGAPAWPTFTGGTAMISLNGTQSGTGGPSSLLQGVVGGSTQFAMLTDDAKGYVLPTQAVDQAGTALTFTGRTNLFASRLSSAAVFGQELFVAAGNPGQGIPMRFAGNGALTAAVPYSTGTIAGSSGSAVLTGAGGASWNSSMEGGYVYINDADVQDRAYRIIAVRSATSMEVDRPLAGDVAATSYRITANAAWTCKPGTFGAYQSASTITTRSTVEAQGACQHQGRVFVWDTIDADNLRYMSRLRWSAPINETDSHWGGAEYFQPNAFLDVFPGEGASHYGSTFGILYCASYRGTLYIFKLASVYALRGYVASDGSDEGASVDLVANIPSGIAGRPVVSEEGIYFCTKEAGLCLLDGSGITSITDRSGVSTITKRIATQGSAPSTNNWYGWTLSVLRDRIIMQALVSLASSVASGIPNTLVYDRRLRTWSTQTTVATTNVIEPWTTRQQVGVALSSESAAVEGEWVGWHGDNEFETLTAEDSRYPLMRVTTHPISLAGADGPNGRLRAAQVKAKVVDPAATNPVLGVSVLLGEEGSNAAVEAAISATSSVPESVQTEKWHRLAVRSGTAPVDQARVRLVQSGGSKDVRVMEVGIEHVPVARFR